MISLNSIKDSLIHDTSCFQAETLNEKAIQYDFPQPVEVEAAAWDYELIGQLQAELAEQLVLKGGTAAQLYLPIEYQRASVDIDMLSLVKPEQISATLKKISSKFQNQEGYFEFRPYTPEAPDVDLPMATYFVIVPSALAQVSTSARGRIEGRSIKLDFFFFEQEALTQRLERPTTFAIDLAFSPICLTPGALIGDKLLTLATKSIGIPLTRAGDIPKQWYDLDNLTRLPLDSQAIFEVCTTMENLTRLESSYRKENIPLMQALSHIQETLEDLSQIDLQDASREMRTYIRNLHGQYVRRQRYVPFYGWAIKALRLKFFLSCLQEVIAKRIKSEQMLSMLTLVDETEQIMGIP
jgi:hypothetical protein